MHRDLGEDCKFHLNEGKRNVSVIFVHRGNVLCLLEFLKNRIVLNSLILVIRISYCFFYHIRVLGFLFNYLLFVR